MDNKFSKNIKSNFYCPNPCNYRKQPINNLNFKFPGLGVYDKKKLAQPVIWFVALELMIQGSSNSI